MNTQQKIKKGMKKMSQKRLEGKELIIIRNLQYVQRF